MFTFSINKYDNRAGYNMSLLLCHFYWKWDTTVVEELLLVGDTITDVHWLSEVATSFPWYEIFLYIFRAPF